MADEKLLVRGGVDPILEFLSGLPEAAEEGDVVFVCAGRERVRAHLTLLLSTSRLFRDLARGSSDGADDVLTVHLPDFSSREVAECTALMCRGVGDGVASSTGNFDLFDCLGLGGWATAAEQEQRSRPQYSVGVVEAVDGWDDEEEEEEEAGGDYLDDELMRPKIELEEEQARNGREEDVFGEEDEEAAVTTIKKARRRGSKRGGGGGVSSKGGGGSKRTKRLSEAGSAEHKTKEEVDAAPPAAARRHVCKLCGLHFSNKFTLHYHKQKHDAPSLACTRCPRTFKSKKGLRYHMNLHDGVADFLCDDCGRGFVTKQKLQNHRRAKHTFERPYICDECGEGFTRSDKLVVHKRRAHTGEKPYLCDRCEWRGVDSSSLIHHKKRHGGGDARKKDNCKRDDANKAGGTEVQAPSARSQVEESGLEQQTQTKFG